MAETVARNPRTAFRQFDGVTLVITPDDRRVHRLNPTATFIWDRVGDKAATLDELALEMEREFDAPRPRIEKDLAGFIREMADKNILVVERGHE